VTLQVWERDAAPDHPGSAPAGSGPSAEAPSAAPGRARPRVLWIAATVLAAALVAAAVWVGLARAAHRGQPLDPGNPGPEGARAVARVLDQRGVALTVARGEEELLSSGAPAGRATVVVTNTGELSETTARTLLDHAAGARRIVLVQPSRFVLAALDLPVEPADGGTGTQVVQASCALDGLSPRDAIVPEGRAYDGTGPATECFPHGEGSALVALPPDAAHPEVVVLGDPAVLRNDSVTRLDHAGVAVRMLGQGDRLTWYVPSALDVTDFDSTPTSEIPRALWPLLFLGLFGLVVLMLWRGRRFGPLVTEPLPAVVKAIETTQSRGRLYRKAGDTGRAGAALRTRSTGRLAVRLGLPAGAAPAAVADAAAAATGADPTRVHAVLAGPAPATEGELVALAHDLSQLEKEVRRA